MTHHPEACWQEPPLGHCGHGLSPREDAALDNLGQPSAYGAGFQTMAAVSSFTLTSPPHRAACQAQTPRAVTGGPELLGSSGPRGFPTWAATRPWSFEGLRRAKGPTRVVFGAGSWLCSLQVNACRGCLSNVLKHWPPAFTSSCPSGSHSLDILISGGQATLTPQRRASSEDVSLGGSGFLGPLVAVPPSSAPVIPSP